MIGVQPALFTAENKATRLLSGPLNAMTTNIAMLTFRSGECFSGINETGGEDMNTGGLFAEGN
jgi:hypothetical protein